MNFSSDARKGVAFAALNARLLERNNSLADYSYSDRLQTTSDVVDALSADGKVPPAVANIASSLLHDIRHLFDSLQSAVAAPTAVDADFLDKQIADLTSALSGIYEIAAGDPKSDTAYRYAAKLLAQGQDKAARVPEEVGAVVLEEYRKRVLAVAQQATAAYASSTPADSGKVS